MFVVYFAVKVSVIRVLINHLRSLTKVKVSKKQISNIKKKIVQWFLIFQKMKHR